MVKLNDIFPVAGALETFTMGVTLTGFPAGTSSSPKAAVFSYTNTAEGAHIMQIDTTPPAARNSTTLDDDATRLIVVGTPPAAVDVDKVGTFLVDADGNGIITPGDTIKYTIVASNVGTDDLTSAKVFDDFDETLVGTPVNVTGGGTVNPGNIVWNLGDLLAGQSVSLTYEVTILATVDEDALLANIAMLTTDQTPAIFDNTRVAIHDNDVPTVDEAMFAVNENEPAGTVVGTVSATDPDDESTTFGTLSYAIVGGDPGGVFAIDGTGQITTTAPLDYETQNLYVLTVQVTDGGMPGLSDIATVTINVNDLNEGPTGNAEILGLVWEDFNNDGEVNFGEQAISGVTIHLAGIDDLGNAVSQTQQTDSDGFYLFFDLRPGAYMVSEMQPAGFDDGQDVVGTVDGLTTGIVSANDVFSEIVLDEASVGENYNFGERPSAEGDVVAGQTATIGYWQNKNGQALLESLNGGASSTQLSTWLAATFSNMYGGNAGANNLTGFDNGDVADFYTDLFRRKKKEALQLGLGGPVKTDAQVMAVAFATYVTNGSLAGSTASACGFLVTEHGVGARTFNVGDAGAAFDVADNTDLAILDLLFATNEHSFNGVLYDEDGDGDADDEWETMLRTLANDVYSAINEQGDIL
jgi:uncharacterized repeat protein (TIGR01451 family)